MPASLFRERPGDIAGRNDTTRRNDAHSHPTCVPSRLAGTPTASIRLAWFQDHEQPYIVATTRGFA